MHRVDELYGSAYYQTHCDPSGQLPYERNEHWLRSFGRVADSIIQGLHPRSVLDAGCAMGFLVEALRVRGVDASGFDFSDHAIKEAHESIADHVWVGSLTEPIEGRFDLVTCIEVLEHLPPGELDAALRNLVDVTDIVLISTTPEDFVEPTHFNVQPPEYWAAKFAELGFFRDLEFDASFLTPWAALYRREDASSTDVVRAYERDRWKLQRERDALRVRAMEQLTLDAAESGAATPADEIIRLRSETQDLQDRLRLAIDAAHAADAQRATVEGRLRHVEYALWAAEAREETTGEMVERIYDAADGDLRRLEAMLDARSYRAYWRLLGPYRWVRDRLR